MRLHTDSEYLINGITKWIFAWKRKKWRKGQKPVKNADLWQELDEAVARHKVSWNWVRGHSGDPLNELCDQLAVLEIAKLKKENSKESLKKALEEFTVKQNSKPWLDPAIAGPNLFEAVAA
jgi:ribonuclease HI